MDIVDLRDIVDNREDDSETYDAWDKALMEDIDSSIDEVAKNEPCMIPERDFVEYAQELADDCGLINTEAKWPYNCIDWERAAEELAYDYSLVRVEGVTYYFRSY